MAGRVIANGQITTTALTTIFTVANSQVNTVTSFVLTNETTSPIEVTVFVNASSADRRLTKVTIPAGLGKSVQAFDALGSYSVMDQVKLQSSGAGTYNYFVTGTVENV